MGKLILILGKICSGKSRYAERLKKEGALVFSSDELIKAAYPVCPMEQFFEIEKRLRKYLFFKAVDGVRCGATVALDFGFWNRAEREKLNEYLISRNVEYEWHYISITENTWDKNIKKRNGEIESGRADAYYIEDGKRAFYDRLFEEPTSEFIHVTVMNNW